MARRAAVQSFQPPRWSRLDWLAFGLLIAIVFARCTMQERLREPFPVMPASNATPRAAGPATSLGLDLLSCVPALLVLLRRCIDKDFRLAFARSVIPLVLLDVWMLASTAWASDKFAALITACHWTAASIILWTAMQLCRDWGKLRILAAATVGLLAVLVISGLEFRFVEWPTTLQTYEQHRGEMLRDAGMQPGTFAATQFEKKLKLGELFGFYDSPNTFGGITSLLLVLTVGQLIQFAADKTKRPWSLTTLAIMLAAGLLILALTRSRGAATTLALALLAFALLVRLRNHLFLNPARRYWIGLAILCLAFAAVIGHGMYHHRLPTSTLTFRWQYWVGSVKLFLYHPFRGVGWSNFGLSYLAHRLPVAPEEIKDPHNFLVRFFTELGIIGGLLLMLWLMRLWWELIQPRMPSATLATASNTGPGAINFIAAISVAALAIWLIAGVDWPREPAETYLVRILFLGAMIVAASLTALPSVHSQELDASPAPWILIAALLAIAGMFIHNLIDFSISEIGPMMLLFLLIGCALGLRHQKAIEPRPGSKAVLAIAILAWLAALLILWIPLLSAEQDAADADEDVRTVHFADAQNLFLQANQTLYGLNSDYAYRAAIVSPFPQNLDRLHQAIRQNPQNSTYYFDAARLAAQSNPSDATAVQHDFEHGLQLDPNNVPARLAFADALAKLGDPTKARRQYQLALHYNDLLDPAETKRLTSDQIAEVHRKVDLLPYP